MRTLRWHRAAPALLGVAAVASCGVGIQPLMPTPILFSEGGAGPLSHVPPDERWMPRRVYFATDRARIGNRQEIAYGNDPSDRVAMGISLIRFGDRSLTWEELQRASQELPRDAVIELENDGIVEASEFPRGASPDLAAQPRYAGWILEDLDRSIAAARDKDVLVYVHGAKVNFYNGCAFAAQLDHFMGRDMTSVAFCWPTRQRISAYALGGDRQRAYRSAESLASLLELLADGTSARRIHVLCWSAGGRVTTEALRLLRERSPDVPVGSLRERLRLGAVYFAAADVPLEEFLRAMPTINGLVDRFVVSVSSNDSALVAAARVMGGGSRIGQRTQELTPEQADLIEDQERLVIIDVSAGAGERGFDITGHRYWFDHPWASSDVILTIRSDLDPAERGLERLTSDRHWAMPSDYPERISTVLDRTSIRKR